MAWRVVTIEDDPDSGQEFDDWRACFRDNDTLLSLEELTYQNKLTGITALNQTFPSVVACGVPIRMFIPAWAKTLRVKFYVGRRTSGAPVRTWAQVRVDPGGANLNSALQDTNVSPAPWTVTVDVSSLAEGVYVVDLYAGHAGASGDLIIAALPSGRDQADPLPLAVGFDDAILNSLRIDADPDWTTSPSSVLNDADIEEGDAITAAICTAFYDRDQKLRQRGGGMLIAEQSWTSAGGSGWSGLKRGNLIYVPKWADILDIAFEIRVSGGGSSGQCQFVAVNAQGTEVYTFSNVHHSEIISGYTNTSYAQAAKQQINLSAFRGKEVEIGLRVHNNTVGQTTFVRALNAGHSWLNAPMNTANSPAGDKSLLAHHWQHWPAVARAAGGAITAGWKRRLATRDREMLERGYRQRAFSWPSPGTAGYTMIVNSEMRIRQPAGIGAEGGRLVMYAEIVTPNGVADLRCDYTDMPDVFLPAGSVEALGVGAGKHKLVRMARADRDDTDVTIGIAWRGFSGAGSVIRCLEDLAFRMRWELP